MISQNGLRMPELLTSMDYVFKFSCDYTESAMKKSNNKHHGLGRITQMFPSTSRFPSVFSQQMVDYNGELTVDLDEVLELHFEMQGTTHEYDDFYIKECSMGKKNRLRYIENGCLSPIFENKLVHNKIESVYKNTKIVKLQPYMFIDDTDRGLTDVECTFEYCNGQCDQPDCDAMAEEEKEAERRKLR